MREFLIDEKHSAFLVFGRLHLFVTLIFLLLMWLIYENRNKLSVLKEIKLRKIELVFVSVLFLNMFIYYISKVYYGVYDWHNHLPLHFCFISGYTFMYAGLLKKRYVYKYVYFWAFMGPVPAIIWPDISSGTDAFIFYQLVISHHVFLLFNMFLYYSYNINIKLKDLFKSLAAANIVFISMAVFNKIFETNYIMSDSLPEYMLELYPFLEKVNTPFWILEISAVVVIFLAYIPVYFRNKELEGE